MRYVVIVAGPNEFERMVAEDAARMDRPRVRGRKGDYIVINDDVRYMRIGERSVTRLRGFSGPTELRISPNYYVSAGRLEEIRHHVNIMNATTRAAL